MWIIDEDEAEVQPSVVSYRALARSFRKKLGYELNKWRIVKEALNEQGIVIEVEPRKNELTGMKEPVITEFSVPTHNEKNLTSAYEQALSDNGIGFATHISNEQGKLTCSVMLDLEKHDGKVREATIQEIINKLAKNEREQG